MGSSFYLCIMQPAQYLSKVRCQRNQHLRSLPTHRHQPDRGFGVCLSLCRKDELDGICLSSEAGGSNFDECFISSQTLSFQYPLERNVRVIAVSTAFTVVDSRRLLVSSLKKVICTFKDDEHDHCSLQYHSCSGSRILFL